MTNRKEKDIEEFIFDINRKWQLSVLERDVIGVFPLYSFSWRRFKQIHNAINDDEMLLQNIPESTIKRFCEYNFNYVSANSKSDLVSALNDLKFNWASKLDIDDHIDALEKEGYTVFEFDEQVKFLEDCDVIDFNLFSEISEKFNKANTFERQKMRDLIVNLC